MAVQKIAEEADPEGPAGEGHEHETGPDAVAPEVDRQLPGEHGKAEPEEDQLSGPRPTGWRVIVPANPASGRR